VLSTWSVPRSATCRRCTSRWTQCAYYRNWSGHDTSRGPDTINNKIFSGECQSQNPGCKTSAHAYGSPIAARGSPATASLRL
jgi:hypothetical protein